VAALSGARRVLAGSGGVATAVVLSGVSLYGWLQSRGGHALAEAGPPASAKSLRSSVASSRLARRIMRFRMADGSVMRCRIVDSGGLLSVWADRDYDIPGVDWAKVRQIVDIGAHVGSFTVWAARRAPNARCLAVEPNPGTFELLQANVRANGLEARVATVNAAVGTAHGTAGLELVEHSLGTRLARNGAGEVTVDVETITSLLENADMRQPDVLKVDCEGMEYELFPSIGAERLRGIGVIACEYHPEPGHSVEELDAILRSANFDVRRPDQSLGVLWATHPAPSTV
jgi:FkbM family methyltransferase